VTPRVCDLNLQKVDRIGELCPACKKGHLQPTGQSNWDRTNEKHGSFVEARGYQCDNPECAILHAGVQAGVGVGVSADLRVSNPKDVNGQKMLVTTVKTRVETAIQETTVRRTTEGERADIQLKFINHPDRGVEYLHIHCQSDYELSPWGISDGRPISDKYEFYKENGKQIILCRICKRAWSLAGWSPD